MLKAAVDQYCTIIYWTYILFLSLFIITNMHQYETSVVIIGVCISLSSCVGSGEVAAGCVLSCELKGGNRALCGWVHVCRLCVIMYECLCVCSKMHKRM